MKKKLVILSTTLCLTFSVLGVAIFSSKSPIRTKASEPYSCELPSGYAEIGTVTEYIHNQGTSVVNPYTFRGTVTEILDDYIFVQRTNQTTHWLDGIKITNTNTYADFLAKGNVVDVTGGTLFLDGGVQPALDLTGEGQVEVAYETNPTGYSPKVFQSLSEWEYSDEFYDEYRMYSCSIRIEKAKYLGSTTYEGYQIAWIKDFYSNTEHPILLLSDDNDTIISTMESAAAQEKSVGFDMFFDVFTFSDGAEKLVTITDSSSVSIGDYYVDTDLINSSATAGIYWGWKDGQPYGYQTPIYYLDGKGDVAYADFGEFYTNLMLCMFDSNYYDYFLLHKQLHVDSGVEYVFYYNYFGMHFLFETDDDCLYIINDASDIDTPFETIQNSDKTKSARYFVDGMETDYCQIDFDSSEVNEPWKQFGYDFGAYNIDVVRDKYDNVYVPATLAMDVICADKNWDFAFNGDNFYYMAALENELFDHYMNNSKFTNLDNRSEAMAVYTYNELAFIVENLYGLAEYKIPEDSSFYSIVEGMGLVSDLLSTSTADYEYGVAEFVARWLSDGHASYEYPSPYAANNRDYYQSIGGNYSGGRNVRVQKLINDQSEMRSLRNDADKNGVYFETYDDTAIIRFDAFNKASGNTTTYYENITDQTYSYLHGFDSPLLFYKAFSEIQSMGGSIKNVVVDITNNGGGAVDSLPWLEAFFTDDPSLTIKQGRTGEVITTHYDVDLNRNGVFGDEGDTFQGKYNFYLLTSNFSFSCGNAFPTLAKSKGFMTIIGETSGGGECSVEMFATACGTIIRNSSNNHIGYYDYDNSRFVGNDGGIAPDHTYPREEFYNLDYLVNFIHTL